MRLRPARPGDAAEIAAIYRPFVEESYISFETEAPEPPEIRERMLPAGESYPWLVAEGEDGAILGYAYASAFRARRAYRFAVETTVYVRSGLHGRGIGRRLYEPLLALLEAQGFTQAFGAISLPNAGSVALHERLGFVQAGVYRKVGYKNGRWHDVGLWQRPLAGAEAEPAEPRLLSELDAAAYYDR